MRALVIGDTILDKYIYGTVSRISPEAPVPVLEKESTSQNLGGACNVAVNIKSLSPDTEVDFFGFASFDIVKMLQDEDINCISVSVDKVLTKTRLVAGSYQLLRLDEQKEYSKGQGAIMSSLFKGIDFDKYDVIVVSDYDKGSITEELLTHLTDSVTTHKIFLDLKKFKEWMSDLDFRRSIIKCNKKEYEENRLHIFDYKWHSGMFVTQGRLGYSIRKSIMVEDKESEESFPTVNLPGQIVDVVGAGDVFLAGMVAKFLEHKKEENTLGINKSIGDYGNLASAVRVRKFGDLRVTKREVDEQLQNRQS